MVLHQNSLELSTMSMTASPSQLIWLIAKKTFVSVDQFSSSGSRVLVASPLLTLSRLGNSMALLHLREKPSRQKVRPPDMG